MDATSDTSKILEKGPEYLRKQMELESETKGRVSAVERLAATKPKYVKSQQVVNSTQEPVISLGSASVSSTGSSNTNHDGNLATESDSREATCAQLITKSPGEVRRSSSKKRPDSLLLYRQKCDLLRGSGNYRKLRTRKVLHSSVNKNVALPEATDKECEAQCNEDKISTPEGTAKECSSNIATSQSEQRRNGVSEKHRAENSDSGAKVTAGAKKSAGLLTVLEQEKRSGKGVSRSHSDISSRYSKNFADFDAFFKYCGLGGEIIESLGRENFSAHSDDVVINIRSVSISTSDDGFSRNSGDSDGLMEEKLNKKKSQGTSVIERNARIIKWLYSCKNATETGKKLRDLD
ncbi:protein FAM110C [Plectropomus leopardus]|uniref:protein FAM110C n=1 Tax=Plectropomus leopardus TaxID=160734 RepID=UPI001C4D59C6|nr:protein FAM110C [Plectropomus leopardus]